MKGAAVEAASFYYCIKSNIFMKAAEQECKMENLMEAGKRINKKSTISLPCF